MTGEEQSSLLYLDKEDYKLIHSTLREWAVQDGEEPIPSFELAKFDQLEALVHGPRQSFFGISAYPSIAEKAAFIFYKINKSQIFLNGNKRMSTLSLLVFLGINSKSLKVPEDELTAKAIWLSKTPALEFLEIKKELSEWIQNNLQDKESKSLSELAQG